MNQGMNSSFPPLPSKNPSKTHSNGYFGTREGESYGLYYEMHPAFVTKIESPGPSYIFL